jgi:chromosome segregation ATPase
MSDQTGKIKKKIEEYQERLAYIDEAETMLINQIKAEKAEIPADSKAIERKYKDASREIEHIQKQIHKVKLNARRLKYIIKGRKQQYDHLLEKTPEKWQKVSERIKILGDKIAESESTISALEVQKLAAEQTRSMAMVSLEAYKSGVYAKTIEGDPRMKSVLTEKKRIERYIKNKQAELETGAR